MRSWRAASHAPLRSRTPQRRRTPDGPTLTSTPRSLLSATRAALVAASVALAACAKPPEAAPVAPEAVDVRLDRVTTADLPRTLRAVGSTRADEEMTVAAVVSGRVVDVLREVGDRVKPGDPLVNVDDADYVLERDQRRRALNESLARLGLDALPAGDIDVSILPAVERARLATENAQSKFDRAQKLYARPTPLISDQDLADLKTAWEVAASDLRLAQITARTQLAEARTRQSQLDTAEKRLRDARHVVPGGTRPGADGGAAHTFIVAERFVSPGDYVGTGTHLFRLVDVDPLQIRAAVPERRMEEIPAGTLVRVTLAAARAPVEGRVVRVRPEVDPATRTVQVEIHVPNADLKLTPGGFATVEFEVGTDRGVPLVPESAVRMFAGVRKVFVVDGGKAAERVVTLGRRSGDRVEIVSGLKPGDMFVPAPPPGLYAGAPVRVEGAAAPAPAEKGK